VRSILNQISWVSCAVDRLLWVIDKDPLSPTYGCAHLDYWRDKTSDVSDARRQESMLPLALLYTHDFQNTSCWKGNPVLLNSVQALLNFWIKSQYSDGSLDEWYKGERAFAAAAFTAHAVARTLEIVSSLIDPVLESRARNALSKTAAWLTVHDDLFKTNHQAVGAGALAYCGRVLGAPHLFQACRCKLDSIVAVQNQEGWFPEVTHMDLGYTFLTVEFAAMAMEVLQDWSWAEPFSKAFDFACEWLNPDLTLHDEYGVCHNPYVSLSAPFLMAKYSSRAAWIARQFAECELGFAGLRATMADDLRLPRWSFQPLVAYEYARNTPWASYSSTPVPLADATSREAQYPKAGLLRRPLAKGKIVVASCAGGLVRFYSDTAKWSEFGYAIQDDGGSYATNLTYNRKIALDVRDDEIVMRCPINPVRRFMPTYLARVALRLACSTALGSRFARKAIDFIRARKGTALNQSSANLSADSKAILTRTVRCVGSNVELDDVLEFSSSVAVDTIQYLIAKGSEAMECVPLGQAASKLPTNVSKLRVLRRFSCSPEWQAISTRLEG